MVATFGQTFGLHTINAVGDDNFQEFNGQGFSANNSDFAVDGIEEYDLRTGHFFIPMKPHF